ncbi:MAG: Manganese transport system ATP-binding protein MntB [Chlamydiia bacterium]|nr:Manganese transport system ATP-binding protein MntB [Chlamydiia bacterium]
MSIEIRDLTVNYDTTTCLWDINLDIPGGQMVGIIGPNGAGKSSLFKAMLGLVKPLSGCVRFFGKGIKEMQKQIAYVPQRKSVDWTFPVRVIDVVLMGAYAKRSLFGRIPRSERVRAVAALERLGMKEFAFRQIDELSGGQQQKVFIARALMQDAKIYLLDEPFNAVDMTTEETIFNLLLELKREGKTILVIHHDLNTVEKHFDYVALINTRLVASGKREEVLNVENIQKAYGLGGSALDDALALASKKEMGIK